MRFYNRLLFFALTAFTVAGINVKAASWPANYQGVMLQGFYWDSYKEGAYGSTRWSDLTKMADELSAYFDLIWVPNSAKANGENGGGNGYMPVYWFTNHNCAYGNSNELKYMISTFKNKGTGIIEDCVLNHRVGVSNWYNFPTETWNGTTYQLTDGAICSTDEMWVQGGQGCPYAKGNPDEGEDFDGARDLDHTNANVQKNCKDYVKFLTTDMGYAGCRYDMTKGYSGYYTGMYNAYAGVKYSVGEYFDGSYDNVKRWIDQTAEYNNGAGQSAAFDFPCKYQINKALGGSSLNCNELVWKALGFTDQPAGMIHYGYQQFAVTFVDNHDTFLDNNKFGSDYNLMAANAFILFSPGTPCIFYPHYHANKAAMQKLIAARKEVGIHNQSTVNVLKSGQNIYVAEITGTKGRAIVKIGSESYSPATGYKLAASGNNYAVWTTDNGGNNDDVGKDGEYYVYFNNTQNWNVKVWAWNDNETCTANTTWPGDAMTQKDGKLYWSAPAGRIPTMIIFSDNGGETRAGSGDLVFVNKATYNPDGSYTTGNGNGGNTADMPETLYLMGNIGGAPNHWAANYGIQMSKDGNKFVLNSVDLEDASLGAGEAASYFSFVTVLGSNANDWDGATGVNSGHRYGASSTDAPLSSGGSAAMIKYVAGQNASSAASWKVAPGKYKVTADFENKVVRLDAANSVDDITSDTEGTAVYYNLQGVRVENPTQGLYIKVVGTSATKVLIK